MNTDRSLWLPAAEMDRCLTEGTSVFEGIFGMPFFAHFAQDEATAAVFHTGMAAMSDPENEPIAAAYDFPGTSRSWRRRPRQRGCAHTCLPPFLGVTGRGVCRRCVDRPQAAPTQSFLSRIALVRAALTGSS